jgi:hypothetical protein
MSSRRLGYKGSARMVIGDLSNAGWKRGVKPVLPHTNGRHPIA